MSERMTTKGLRTKLAKTLITPIREDLSEIGVQLDGQETLSSTQCLLNLHKQLLELVERFEGSIEAIKMVDLTIKNEEATDRQSLKDFPPINGG